MRFHCPAVFAAPQNSKSIIGLRLGLLGNIYCRAALFAIEFFIGEIVPRWLAKRGGADGAYDRSGRMLIGRSDR